MPSALVSCGVLLVGVTGGALGLRVPLERTGKLLASGLNKVGRDGVGITVSTELLTLRAGIVTPAVEFRVGIARPDELTSVRAGTLAKPPLLRVGAMIACERDAVVGGMYASAIIKGSAESGKR